MALSFIFFSIDDLIWDILNIVRKIRRGVSGRLPIERLDSVPPKLLAVAIAAWHEDNVLQAVIDNMVASIQYPASMYHIFIGVYPNDEKTISVVRALEKQYENVHMVVNEKPGPTCKADNINSIIRYIKGYENERRWRFASITIHDSEDVVHPYELKLTNYLLESYDLLQFPVIPLQRLPKLRNVFSNMTLGTYADEFAENHYRTLGSREAMSAVVPSAGTGYVISHAIIDSFGNEPICPEDSLTEDYKLSLTLAEKGFNTHFVLEKVPRLMDNHTVRWDYVATRSFFPFTFKTAVRQKTRWIYGITMQSAKTTEMFRSSRMGFAGRYSLYKDLKAKLSNLVVLPGYMVFIYFIVSLFLDIPVMYPKGTLSYTLCVFLTFMMVFRQLMRAVSITNFYGFKSMAVSCLLPPLMPVRLVWGNIINMTATFKAWKLYFKGTTTKKKKGKVAWSKTDHTFLDKQVLYRYYRNLGDVLLEKQYIDVSTLSDALQISRDHDLRLGEVLQRRGMVTDQQLTEALAYVRHGISISNIAAFEADLAADFNRILLEKLLIYPLLKTREGYVFAKAESTDEAKITKALGLTDKSTRFVYASKSGITDALNSQSSAASVAYQTVASYLTSGSITWEQAVLALDNYAYCSDILGYMGLTGTRRTGIKTNNPAQSKDFTATQNSFMNI